VTFASGTLKQWWIYIPLCIARYMVCLQLANRPEINVGHENYVHVYKHTRIYIYVYMYSDMRAQIHNSGTKRNRHC
jgi:hypothetical protein